MNNIENSSWHSLNIESIEDHFKTYRDTGLDHDEVLRRQDLVGENVLKEGKKRSLFKMALDQFSDFMVLILIASAIIAGFLGEPKDAIAITVIVILNSVLGFIQEYRAEKAMAALKALATSHAKVLRQNKIEVISSRSLVPGDIVLLEAGNFVPADLRLITSKELRIDEAALTGESHSIDKSVEVLLQDEVNIGDKVNMTFKGTLVTHGRGEGIVVATGMKTEIGKIANLISTGEDSKTPLQKRLTIFGKKLALSVLGICTIIFVIGLLRGEKPLLMFMTSLSLAVAAIPEALPAVVTVLLALGAKRLVKQNALIRRLPAVETLGSVTYVCTDKTGTLTQNKMKADSFVINRLKFDISKMKLRSDSPEKQLFFQALALSNDASRSEKEGVQGDPTEIALYKAALEGGFTKSEIEKKLPRIDEIPFSSHRGLMSTIHDQGGNNLLIFTKGAPEKVLDLCHLESHEGETIPFDKDSALLKAEEMAKDGLRVLAIAFKNLKSKLPHEDIENDLIFLGFVGLIDPPRPEAKLAIELCQRARINVVMITGDHPATAFAISRKLGIVRENTDILREHSKVLTGNELSKISHAEFKSRVQEILVYARVSPEQKIYIVKTLQERGEFVAMTGDGINDAPALKRADIGVAMGNIGTDVAREAADMVLLDDNFSTIVSAVKEGRRIFDNIRKFIKYSLTSNAGEIWTLFLAPFLGLPIPFLPIHILWINLVTDGLPGIALAAEPEEKGVMDRPPRSPEESIFAHGLWQHAIWVGILMGLVNLAVMAWVYRTGNPHWQSMVFTVLTLSQMGHVLSIRSERDSFFQQGAFSNKPLLGAVAITFLLQMAVLYIPYLNTIFKTQPLSAYELFICLAVSPIIFFAVEIEKLLIRKGIIYANKKGRPLRRPL